METVNEVLGFDLAFHEDLSFLNVPILIFVVLKKKKNIYLYIYPRVFASICQLAKAFLRDQKSHDLSSSGMGHNSQSLTPALSSPTVMSLAHVHELSPSYSPPEK